jgi:UDP-N-acetyl-D-glucosamine dehydrogenase
MSASSAELLTARLASREAEIGVVGLGYVGLPLAVEFAVRGFRVHGIDLSADRVRRIADGRNYIDDVTDADFGEATRSGRLTAAQDFEAAARCDAVFICVPTPVTLHKDPDVSYIRSAALSLAPHLHAGQAVILKSTTYPDTTEGLVQPILQEAAAVKGLELGRDWFLAFSPERIDPGNRLFTTANTPIVVGGVTDACTEVAARIMEQVVSTVHRVSSPKVAEMEKLLENIFRSVNIALVNELARLCDRIGGVSMWEVIEAASTKPFGFMPFHPGPGLGGHCIPIDPYYLSWLARRYDFETSFITLSARTNEEMPYYVVDGLLKAIADRPLRLTEARVLVLGVAFKRNVDDTRHTPAEKVIEILLEKGVRHVTVSDPHVPEFTAETRHGMRRFVSEPLTRELLEGHDVALILTDHDAFDYELIARHSPLVIDTRNAMARVGHDPARVALLGGGRF